MTEDLRTPIPESKDFLDCEKAANLFITGSPTTRKLVLDIVLTWTEGKRRYFRYLCL
jgi:hypothetical protein